MGKWCFLALFLVVGECTDHKPPFSRDAFLAAKSLCGSADAYVIKTAPNTIGFHGSSDDPDGSADAHVRQAACLKEKLNGTDVQTVVLGSRLYKNP